MILLTTCSCTLYTDLRKAYWDEFVWDQFVWDTNEVSPTEIEVTGTAENMGIFITSTSDQFPISQSTTLFSLFTSKRNPIMAIQFYDHTTFPVPNAAGTSKSMRDELDAIEARI